MFPRGNSIFIYILRFHIDYKTGDKPAQNNARIVFQPPQQQKQKKIILQLYVMYLGT